MNRLSSRYIDIDGLSLDSRLIALEHNLEQLKNDVIESILLNDSNVAVSKPIEPESYLENSYKL